MNQDVWHLITNHAVSSFWIQLQGCSQGEKVQEEEDKLQHYAIKALIRPSAVTVLACPTLALSAMNMSAVGVVQVLHWSSFHEAKDDVKREVAQGGIGK